MNRRNQLLAMAVVTIVLLLGVFGCSKQQERYADPPWLGGTSIETLEKRGNYTIFLKLMEMANYKEPISKQLFTLFAPTDESFNAYFAQQGISSVDALTKDQAVQLFTLHVLRNPRSRYQLIYEYVWAEEQGPQGEYAALFFRKPTPSTSIPYKEVGRYAPNEGKNYIMRTGEKLVPLFSLDYFEDFFGALDGSDYTFMYPDSKWGDNMNWHNAMVMDDPLRVIPANETPAERRNAAAVRTANGFIYLIDRVVAPMQSLEEYLIAHQDKFGLYYDILQRFATYGSAQTDPKTKEVRYLKSYNSVSNIAEEQGAFTGNEVRMKDMYTAFIPSDEVLQAYLNNTIYKTYSSLDSVPEVTLFYILQTQLGRSLGLISKISKSYFNSFGDPMIINKGDIKSAHMCSNGVLYEMNKVLEPNVFRCVPGNLFFNSNYSTFLYALNQAGVVASLSNPIQNVTLFAPTNEQLEKYGIRYNSTIANPTIEFRGSDSQWKPMKTTDLIMFVEDHIYSDPKNTILSDLTGEGFIEMSSGNFMHYKNSELFGPENQYKKDKAVITEKAVNDINGILYYVNNPIKSRFVMGKFLTKDPDVLKFKNLLVKTKLLDERYIDQTTKDTIPNLKFLTEATAWTAFIPTNAAMDAATSAGLVPTETEALKKFLQYHFIRKSTIFDDANLSGVFPSQRIESTSVADGTVYSTLKITNDLNQLSIEDHSGNTVSVDHSLANFLTQKGVVHKITTVLKY